MKPTYKNAEDEYGAISLKVDRNTPTEYVDDLRRIAAMDHVEAMSLLAILLGDIDSEKYRNEIITLYKRSHELGSPVAAEKLSIQYRQWNEPILSKGKKRHTRSHCRLAMIRSQP